MLPVVQSFMQQHGRIGKEIWQNVQFSCSQYVLDHSPLNLASNRKALAAEDINIQAILCSSPTTQHSNILSDKTIDALISFSCYRCNVKPSLDVAKQAVSMAKAFGENTYIASSLWYLGVTFGYLGEFYAAYDHLQEAYELYNTLLLPRKWYSLRKGFLRRKYGPSRSPGNCDLQWLCCQCGMSMVNIALLMSEDGNKVVSLARDVEKQAATVSDDEIHARSLMILGSVLDYYGYRQEALHHLERAKLMGITNCTVSSVYHAIALVHYNEKRLPEALDAAEKAWKLSEPDNNLVELAQISLHLGMFLFSANRDTEAWKYMEISLSKNLELRNRRRSAATLEYMGYGYLRRGDYFNAYVAYEAAAENYLGTINEHPDGTACKDNMAKIKDMQRNPGLNVGFHRPRDDINWPFLYYPDAAAIHLIYGRY